MPRKRDPTDPIVSEDNGLTAGHLHAKYGGSDGGEHPVFTRLRWQDALARRRTLDDYWGWVEYEVALGNEPS